MFAVPRTSSLCSRSLDVGKRSTCTTDFLNRNQIIPDIIDSFIPRAQFNVEYDKGLAKGQEFKPDEVAKAPKVTWSTKITNGTFTLVMVDPDAPNRNEPKMREWRHWVVINIPGCEVAKGEVVTPYVGPSPPPKTGIHRYVFLVYEQKGGKITVEKMDNDNRGKWKAGDFAKKYNLGPALGVQFFQSKHAEQ